MYTVIKTNKKSIVYKFETFQELMVWSEKNRYTQGFLTLRDVNNNEVQAVSNCYTLDSYCTTQFLKMRGY